MSDPITHSKSAGVVDVDEKFADDVAVRSEEVVELPSVDADLAAARQLFGYDETRRLIRKVDIRLLPPLFIAYLLRSMDTNMTSYVKAINTTDPSNILTQLNMSTNDFSFAATAFSVTYAVFEIPSNLTIKWMTPRVRLISIKTSATDPCRSFT